jgi:hypothetical protein
MRLCVPKKLMIAGTMISAPSVMASKDLPGLVPSSSVPLALP